MKIVIINNSDNIGGAAVVSQRLLYALRAEGVDANMMVKQASDSPDKHIIEYGRNIKGKFYFLAERLHIFLKNGFSRANLFKVSTARYGFDISKHKLIREADAIIISWINQGALSLNGVENICKSGKPVFWIMHDMWECTGICHHALECENFKESCGKCQYLLANNSNDLSYSVHCIKHKLYNYGNIHFIPVSNWLAQKCKESSLLRSCNVTVIPNAFPIDNFTYHKADTHDDKKRIVMGAARLDDPIKGFSYMIDAMNEIADNRPELADKVHLILFGTIKDASLLDKIRLPFTYKGALKSKAEIANTYAQSDIVLSTSLYETLPGTIIEGAASGCTPVTFGYGGQRDIVEHLVTGYIAEYKSPKSIADGIQWAVESKLDRQMLNQNISRRFSSEVVARQYIETINKIIIKN